MAQRSAVVRREHLSLHHGEVDLHLVEPACVNEEEERMTTDLRRLLPTATLAAALALTACQQPAPPPAEPVESAADKATKVAEANRAAALRFMDEVLGRGRIEVLDELVAPDFVEHQPLPPGTPTGIEGLRGFVTAFRSAFPDLEVTVEQAVASEDLVALRSVWRGTHQGEWMGVKPSGEEMTFEAFDVLRMTGGKAIEHWGMDSIQQVLVGHGGR